MAEKVNPPPDSIPVFGIILVEIFPACKLTYQTATHMDLTYKRHTDRSETRVQMVTLDVLPKVLQQHGILQSEIRRTPIRTS